MRTGVSSDTWAPAGRGFTVLLVALRALIALPGVLIRRATAAGRQRELAPGMRVRIRATPADVELVSDQGTLIGQDELGYWRVWLDRPARVRTTRGWQEVPVICEAPEQLVVLPGRPAEPRDG